MLGYLRGTTGTSAVEMILVIVIAGFLILLMVNLPYSLGLVGNSSRKSTANEIISKKIEDLRLLGYDNICNPSPDACTDSITDSRLSLLPGGAGEAVIEECPLSVCTNGEAIKKVKITVNWIESGKTMSVEANTLITQGGLK